MVFIRKLILQFLFQKVILQSLFGKVILQFLFGKDDFTNLLRNIRFIKKKVSRFVFQKKIFFWIYFLKYIYIFLDLF